MAPIKFEEQLKEKLEKRTIQPSPEAWKKLSVRLDDQGNNKNHRGYWWLGIAASITGIILAARRRRVGVHESAPPGIAR